MREWVIDIAVALAITAAVVLILVVIAGATLWVMQ